MASLSKGAYIKAKLPAKNIIEMTKIEMWLPTANAGKIKLSAIKIIAVIIACFELRYSPILPLSAPTMTATI